MSMPSPAARPESNPSELGTGAAYLPSLSTLRCPLTLSRLRPEGEFVVAEVGGLRYPVRDGFPVMLIEEAKLPPGVASLEELKAKLNLRDA